MTNLTDLARRVSELQGPSREADEAIFGALFPRGVFDEVPEAMRYVPTHIQSIVPRFTASLDAAMTLVADGKLISLETYDDNGVYPAHVRASAWVQGAPRQFAATPALALTAAALTAAALIARSEA